MPFFFSKFIPDTERDLRDEEVSTAPHTHCRMQQRATRTSVLLSQRLARRLTQSLSSAAITQRRPARQAQPTQRTLRRTALARASRAREGDRARVCFAHADVNRHRRNAHHFAPGCPPGAPPRQPRRSAHSACTTQPCLNALPVPGCCPEQAPHCTRSQQTKHRSWSRAPAYVLPPQTSKVLAPAPRRRVVGPAAHEADEIIMIMSLRCRGGIPRARKRRRATRGDVIPHATRSLRAARTFRAGWCSRGSAPHVRANTNAKARTAPPGGAQARVS